MDYSYVYTEESLPHGIPQALAIKFRTVFQATDRSKGIIRVPPCISPEDVVTYLKELGFTKAHT